MDGYRCHKCLYLTIHCPELKAPITPELQALFDQGNRVGEEARKFFPGGVLVDKLPWDFVGALTETKALMAAGQPIIYEAAFEYQGSYARADIIEFNPESAKWRIYEVKSSTKVKPEQINDAGLQAWIMSKAGIPLEQIHIMHINNECRYPDLALLFKIVDVTEEVRGIYTSIKPKVQELKTLIQLPEVPDVDIGPQCEEPGDCGFIEHCFKQKNIQEMGVFNLPGIWKRKWELYQQGILSLDDPRLLELTEIQQRIVDVHQSGQPYRDTEALKAALQEWQYPLYFLDFETISPAIPRYEGVGPYQQVAFQFSLHYWQDKNSPLYHKEFLWDKKSDPRPALIPALLEACGKEGSIVAYYSPFEMQRIEEMAAFSPEHREALLALLPRFVDPLPLIRAYVYDEAFGGSFSLKKVAPALLGKKQSYANMEVADGGAAQRAFEELIADRTPPAKKEMIKQAMLAYCAKDTEVMVELVKWLDT